MSNKTAIRPLGDRVLVQPKEEKEVTRGGIIIPDTAKEKPMEGTVIAVGIKHDVVYQIVRSDDLLGILG